MVTVVSLVAAGSVVGGLLGLALAGVAWCHREVPTALPFAGLTIAVAAWAFGNAGFLLVETTTGAYVADRVVRAAGAQVAPLWLLFVLAYVGLDEWVDARRVAVLWLVPTAYVVLSITAPLHGLTSTPADVVTLTTGGITAPHVPTDLVFDIHLLFAYLTIGLGYVVLVTFLARSRAVYRRQTVLVLAATLVPVVANVGVHLEWVSHPGVDLTPIAFILMGGAIGWALVRHDFLTVMPLAEDVLIDELPDPVFVLGEGDRVVDYNSAAATAFDREDPAGEPIDEVAPGLASNLDDGRIFRHVGEHRADGASPRHYETSVTTLEDQYGTPSGHLVVLRDVTGQQRRQERLEALQDATRGFLAASTDEEVADVAVDYAQQALGCEATAVLVAADDTSVLEPIAVTGTATELFDSDELVVEHDEADAFRAFEDDETVETPLPPGMGGPVEYVNFLPLGDHGVLAVGTTDSDAFGPDDEGFGNILARTTQVALTRVDRERELSGNRTALERRTEQIAFFNGVLRHSLRNALLVIEGRAEYLRDAVGEGDEEHLDTIARWCADLADLSEEIRSINDTVTASESERLDAVDLSRLLYECVQAYEERYPEATFGVDVDQDVTIMANELARSVVDSVVDNAVEHNDSATPHVEMWTVEAADRVQLHVADDGPGMTHEMKSIVFERSVSTNQTASGFGLHFVSVLMNLYGGHLRFEDNDPEGTVAVLEFQLANDGGE